MTDQYPAPDQHDTTALPRTGPGPSAPVTPTAAGYGYGQPGSQPGYGPGWYGNPGEYPPPVGNPEAERWAARYRRQRSITTVLAVAVAMALVGVLGLGVAAWQFARSNPVLDSVSELAAGLGASPDGLLPEGVSPEGDEGGLVPDGTAPDGTTPDGESPDLSDLPLPEPLRGLGSALGITDVGQLLDLAVVNGLMTQAEADDLRRAIAAGSALQGLADGSQR